MDRRGPGFSDSGESLCKLQNSLLPDSPNPHSGSPQGARTLPAPPRPIPEEPALGSRHHAPPPPVCLPPLQGLEDASSWKQQRPRSSVSCLLSTLQMQLRPQGVSWL